jgi:hypothetical protein
MAAKVQRADRMHLSTRLPEGAKVTFTWIGEADMIVIASIKTQTNMLIDGFAYFRKKIEMTNIQR